jgi:hypothetical protein
MDVHAEWTNYWITQSDPRKLMWTLEKVFNW